MTIASNTPAERTTRTETREPEPARVASRTTQAKPEPVSIPVKEASETTKVESVSETKSAEVTPAAAVGEIEIPAEGKGGNWTVVSIVVGISAAAAGIVILKITKIL